MIVYVESNFILELVFDQEESSSARRILRWAREQKFDLVIPAFSLVEPAWTLSHRQQARARLHTEMERDLYQLKRSVRRRKLAESLTEAVKQIRQISEQDNGRFDRVLRRVLSIARVVDLNAVSLGALSSMQRRFNVSRLDAVVLGAVLADLKSLGSKPNCLFVTRDRELAAKLAPSFRRYNCDLQTSFVSARNVLKNRFGL
jgi:predicted nucleic acid-binding protein